MLVNKYNHTSIDLRKPSKTLSLEGGGIRGLIHLNPPEGYTFYNRILGKTYRYTNGKYIPVLTHREALKRQYNTDDWEIIGNHF